jgi:hypothetical protein
VATSIEERRLRVASGSRRRRDLQAVGAASAPRAKERWQIEGERTAVREAELERRRLEREARLRPQIEMTAAARSAWGNVQSAIERGLRQSRWTYGLWIEPLVLAGEVNDALWLDAPMQKAAWIERRYARLIGDAIRDLSTYRGLFIGRREESDDSDGVL